jgi:tRNA (guanine-N7-)-methyltransferase
MARRALRKLKTPLDLSRQLKRFEELPSPWDPQPLFGRRASLEVEVGSGKGLFLRTAAASRPATDFLGIELARTYAEHAAARLIQAGLSNAVVVSADALRIFAEILPEQSLAAVHVYFPDPWWKQRHRKRRVMRESFLRDVERTLQPGGSLHFWTDVEEYYRSTLAILATASQLAGPLPVPETDARHEMDYRTHFERRTRLQGAPVYRAEFRKAL